jgi:hypothetical protein
MTSRDWTKERWRKQYIREPLQHRSWPVMARGLRELLNALAEDDGTLVRGAEDPIAALLRGLSAQEYELELVEAALGLLLREGFLASDDHSIWIPDLPSSQAQRDATTPSLERTTAPADARQTSTQRVREFRARQRERNAPGVPEPAVSASTGNVAPDEATVSDPVSTVSPAVSPSRGDSDLDPSESSEIERKKQEPDHPHHLSAARESVSPRSADVSSELVSTHWMDEEVSRFSRNPEHALKLPVHERAAFLRAHPRLADALRPEHWPEVVAVGEAFAEGSGQGKQYLGSYDKDDGVRRVVELLAIGFPQQGLEYVARTVPKQAWWSASGRRLGLSSLSPEVVRRNMPSEDGRPRILSPRVAKVLEEVEQRRKANGAA